MTLPETTLVYRGRAYMKGMVLNRTKLHVLCWPHIGASGLVHPCTPRRANNSGVALRCSVPHVPNAGADPRCSLPQLDDHRDMPSYCGTGCSHPKGKPELLTPGSRCYRPPRYILREPECIRDVALGRDTPRIYHSTSSRPRIIADYYRGSSAAMPCESSIISSRRSASTSAHGKDVRR